MSARYSISAAMAVIPYLSRADGPLQAIRTSPSFSSSVGNGTSSVTVFVSGGTGDCQGRTMGEMEPCVSV